MLRINYRDQRSADNYLEKVYYLEFHEIQIVDIERITSREKTINRDDVIRSKSIIA